MMLVLPKILKNNWLPIAVYSLVTLLILWPLLGRGFILTLDMVFTPTLPLPDTVTSSYLLHTGLHVLNFAVPADILQKILLFGTLLLSGLGMHRLMSSVQLDTTATSVVSSAAYASGLLYMINPFTYSRFMAGQYSVLLGYAFIPFFVVALLRFLRQPSFKQTSVLTIWTLIISVVSIHTLGLILVISVIATLQALWRYRTNPTHIKLLAKYGAVAVFAFVVASSYWLLPLVQGNGPTAAALTTFRTTDQTAFATGGDGIAGKVMHVMRLQGFWAESRDLYLLPQDELSIWGLAVTSVWILVIVGVITAWRHKREVGVLFTSTIAIAAVLASGVGMTWLADHIPFFAGYREPQKFVALIALGFAVFVGLAIPRLFAKINSKIGQIGIGVILGLILIGFTPVMFRGFDGQLIPRRYPASWFTINEQLNKDTNSYQVLFLPWHLYMRYDFASRIIASPGKDFFGKQVLVSDNPEIGNVGPAVVDNQKLQISNILSQASQHNTIGHQLALLQVKYVLLAKDDDFKDYGFLDQQTDLQLITETTTLKLYLNTAFGKASE